MAPSFRTALFLFLLANNVYGFYANKTQALASDGTARTTAIQHQDLRSVSTGNVPESTTKNAPTLLVGHPSMDNASIQIHVESKASAQPTTGTKGLISSKTTPASEPRSNKTSDRTANTTTKKENLVNIFAFKCNCKNAIILPKFRTRQKEQRPVLVEL